MQNETIRILIVDDHQIMIDGIKSMLSKEPGIIVIAHANNGKQAIELLEKIEVDVILMDVEMPIMNGIDATTQITKKHPQVNIIALTTYDEKSIINIMLKAGAKGYILKNINRNILVDAIHRVADGMPYHGTDVSIALAKDSLNEKTKIPNTENTNITDSILSKREIEILRLIVNGSSNKEIGNILYISPKTVETHRNNIMKKLDVHNTASLVKKAIKSGLVD
jgi:two-component system, NarL family, nitrate/nitrite response regulator NarL